MYAQFFGTFLLSHNVITKEQLISALAKKASAHLKIGTLAIHKGYMSASEVDRIIILQTHKDCRFGELAVSEGYLTEEQVLELAKIQSQDFLLLGQILVQDGLISNSQLEMLINEYESENELNDLDYCNEKKEDLDLIISHFLRVFNRPLSEYELSYIRLLFNNLIRFIGEDFTPVTPIACSEYPVNYCVSQVTDGSFTFKTYIDMPKDVCITFASRYVRDNFTEFDEYVQASMEDFLNLHNGLYNVNISNTFGTELSLNPPEIADEKLLTLKEGSYLIPIIYPFGTIHFLFEAMSF